MTTHLFDAGIKRRWRTDERDLQIQCLKSSSEYNLIT